MEKVIVRKWHSEAGLLALGSQGGCLVLCDWMMSDGYIANVRRLKRMHDVELEEGTSPVIEMAIARLEEYFAGKRRDFDLPLMPVGTPFQQKVWEALPAIPYGKTATYADIASAIGMPRALRAVAQAIGSNPVSIFIPCHRVIGKDGSLTGYSGGIEAKRALLEIETRYNYS